MQDHSHAQLSVNLNAVALLRNRRDMPWPSVTGLGRLALEAGAAGLTVHPRPDQRHIRNSDLAPIKRLLAEEFEGAEFNIEGYPTPDFLSLVRQHQPHQVTLVPDEPSQPTSDHGWDFITHQALLTDVVAPLRDLGFRVALFCDPDASEEALIACRATGAHRVELYTGPYGAAHAAVTDQEARLKELATTAKLAGQLGLDCNAGHDLTVANVGPLAAKLPNLREVSIGHGLTADALTYGMAETVRRFNRALQGKSQTSTQ